MKTNYVLIDYENVHLKSISLLKGDRFQVFIFLGPKNTKLPVDIVMAMHEFGKQAKYVSLETSGANALDFHIAYYLGELVSANTSGIFHIISKDTGFDPLIKHLKTRKIAVERSVSIEVMPCFQQSSKTPLEVKKSTPEQKHSAIQNDELLNKAIIDLIKRKTAKPRTTKTLLSTLHAKCGKELSVNVIKTVYDNLVKLGYVKVEGAKVSYNLPAAWP
jgi:hypothetical protein